MIQSNLSNKSEIEVRIDVLYSKRLTLFNNLISKIKYLQSINNKDSNDEIEILCKQYNKDVKIIDKGIEILFNTFKNQIQISQ